MKKTLSKESFLEHFKELKSRLLFVFISFALFFAGSYIFSDNIYEFLLRPLENYFIKHNLNREIIYTGLAEAFFTYIKLSFYVALFLSFPVIIWQIYQFIAPGLTTSEKQFVLPLFIIAPILLTIGAVLVYYLVLPTVFDFFLSFEKGKTSSNLPIILEARVSEYLSLCLTIMLAFGLAFQLPVILVVLVKLGLSNSKALTKYRRLAIVVIFIIAAIITPPDIISQIILAVIMIILYELSVFACKYIENNQKDKDA